MDEQIKPLRMFPDSWSKQWVPQVNENCRVSESYGIFNQKEIVVVETTIPGRNFVYVSKLLEPNVTGQIPIDNLERMN